MWRSGDCTEYVKKTQLINFTSRVKIRNQIKTEHVVHRNVHMWMMCVILEDFVIKTQVKHVNPMFSHVKPMWEHVNPMGFYHETFQIHTYTCAFTCVSHLSHVDICVNHIRGFTCDFHMWISWDLFVRYFRCFYFPCRPGIYVPTWRNVLMWKPELFFIMLLQ